VLGEYIPINISFFDPGLRKWFLILSDILYRGRRDYTLSGGWDDFANTLLACNEIVQCIDILRAESSNNLL
jgi:hypothetical protein